MLQGNHLSKQYGDTVVLEDISVTFSKGITGLVAPSGSGKTTLLRILAGLEPPDKGAVLLPHQNKLSMVFQEDRLFPTQTVLQNVALPLGESGEEKALFWLNQLGLGEKIHQFSQDLSGGMKRRVALARALAYEGDLLFLDEPFKGLDFYHRKEIMEMVKDYSKDRITLLVTHDLEEIISCANCYMIATGPPFRVLEQGEISQSCSLEETKLLQEQWHLLMKNSHPLYGSSDADMVY